MYQGGHITRLAEALRQAFIDVALCKDGASGRFNRQRRDLLAQLQIVSRIAAEMADGAAIPPLSAAASVDAESTAMQTPILTCGPKRKGD